MLKKIDGFIIALICVIVFAWFIPISDHTINTNLETITDIGISLIFLFYGLKLSPKEMKMGLANYKLHILIQATTFLLFPLLILCLLPLVSNSDLQILWMALFFMAALPSTVSSSVVMVSIAKGNIPAAIFNASLSGLLGVIITPIWIAIFMTTSAHQFSLTDSVVSLILKIILPVCVGLVLNKRLGHIAQNNKRALTLFDKSVILTIVYHSFSNSFSSNIFGNFKVSYIIYTLIITIGVFVIVYLISNYVALKLGFSREDRITASFCGSKKSLVHGSVMAKVLFKGMSTQGVFIVPIMIYHSIQLVIISFIAQKEERNTQKIKD